jgi:gluconokinase
MNIHTMAWHEPSLELAHVKADQLPELLAPTEVLAGYGLPVVAGAGDGPLANLGTGAIRPGMAALSLGTSGALRAIRDTPGVDDRGRTFCYALADGLWVVGGAISNGGVVGTWAADCFDRSLDDLLAEAEQADPAGLIALPYLLGERAPWWDPDLTAVLLGLRHEHGRAAITRAMVEGVGQQLALVASALTEVDLTEIRATGGAFRSPIWGRVIASALNRALSCTTDEGGSGLGAALLGWHALGELPSLADAADLITPTDTIHPDQVLAARLAEQRPLIEQAHEALSALVTHIG